MRFEDGGIIILKLSEPDVVQLEISEIVLSALNTQVCITAVVQTECKDIRNLTFELNWSDDDPMYDVNFQRCTLSISITCQEQQGIEGGISPITPTGSGTYACAMVEPVYIILG